MKEAAGYLKFATEILRHELHWVSILEQRRLVFVGISKDNE